MVGGQLCFVWRHLIHYSSEIVEAYLVTVACVSGTYHLFDLL